MVKVIIIGNGFDLAHGLKTGYKDFIKHLFDEYFLKRNSLFHYNEHKRKAIFGLSSKFSFDFFVNNLEKSITNKVCTIENNFLHNLISDIQLKNWVDIEEKYFSLLKNTEKENIKFLNDEFDVIKSELEKYLKKITAEYFDEKESNYTMDKFIDIFKSGNPQKIWFINFNYTPTLNDYKKRLIEMDNIPSEIIHIHGRVNSKEERIIFGYGDEETNDYNILRDKNINEYIKNIKSNLYNQNYTKMIRLLKAQTTLCNIGHSLGLSDRTLLREIFTNKNTRTIKLFYHKNQSHFDNLKMNISRIFLEDKSYKYKVIDYEGSEKIPQHND